MQEHALEKVHIFVGREGLDQLEPDWLQLALKEGRHFLHYPGWYRAQLATGDNDQNVYFVALFTAGNKLMAVMPFELGQLGKGHAKLPVLQLFYPSEMGVNDVLATQPLHQFRGAILKHLKKSLPYFGFIRWQCAIADGRAATILADPKQFRITHASKYLDFSEGQDAFWAGYKSKFRKGLQKKMHKAEELGTLRLECVTQMEALPQAFEEFLQVEDSGWKGQKGTSVVKQPKKLAYYQSLMDSYGNLGLCQINLLYLGDTAIAAQFGIRVHDRLYLLKIGFREDFASISPGYLILAKLIEQSSALGTINSVSFVTGVDWIDRWHPKAQPVGIFYTSTGSILSTVLVKSLLTAVKIKNRRAKAVAVSAESEPA